MFPTKKAAASLSANLWKFNFIIKKKKKKASLLNDLLCATRNIGVRCQHPQSNIIGNG